MKKRLQIVIFDGSFKTTSFIKRLVTGLLENHDVSIIGFAENESSPLKNVTYRALGSADKPLRLFTLSIQFALKALLNLGKPALFFKSLQLLASGKRKQLQQHNFDIAVAQIQPDIFHLQWPSLLPWCESLLPNPRTKVVLSQRGYQNNVRPFVTPENLSYLKSMYPKLDGFHSVSKSMSATGDSVFTATHKIDDVVYSGFNFAKLQFQEDYDTSTKLQLLSIGRPHWVKGYIYALQACQILKTKGILFHYTIVGAKGNEELVYRIHEYGLERYVTLTDKIPQEEVYRLMRQQDVLLFPSIAEGLPNVVVEAMAIGLPVIATACGGVEELLDETTGVVIPTRDAKQLAAAVISFTKTSMTTINQRRLNARKHVELQHSEQQMVMGMEALYYKCLES